MSLEGKAIILNKKFYIVCRSASHGHELMPLTRVKWTYELVASGTTVIAQGLSGHVPLKLSNNVGEGWYCVRGVHNGETILLEHMSLKQIVHRMTFRQKKFQQAISKCRADFKKINLTPRPRLNLRIRSNQGIL